MNNYLISWHLIDAEGDIRSHPEGKYPLGHNMWFRDYRVKTLKNEHLRSLPELRFVSSTIMKMVVRPTSNGSVFRYKGKQSSAEGATPWSYLKWYPDDRASQPRDYAGRVPHHILMRFGANAPTGRPIWRPGRGCPNPIQYLLHRTDLLDPNEDPDAHHDLCFFDVPVGIFWGMVGLRSLNHWWVVPSLVGDGDWLKTDVPRGHSPENFDPTPYQPVNATLPSGCYLRIRIAVEYERPRLQHSYFRFWPRGEIHVDPADDEYQSEGESDNDEDPRWGESDNDEDPRWGDEPEQQDSSQMQMVLHSSRSPEEQIISHRSQRGHSGLPRRHTGQEFHRPPSYGDVRMMSPPPHEECIHASLRRHNTREESMETPSPPSIPESLKLEDLYISEWKLEPEDIILEQTNENQKDLLRRGTGIGLQNNLPSSMGETEEEEEEEPTAEVQKRRKDRSRGHGRHYKYGHEGYVRDAQGELAQYHEEEHSAHEYSNDWYSEHDRATHPRRDLPVAPESIGITRSATEINGVAGNPTILVTQRKKRARTHIQHRPYHFRSSSPGRDYMDGEDERDAAMLAAHGAEGDEFHEAQGRHRRKKSAYQETYYHE
ncbi:uncharacterized protein DFL_008427 [Arthrobotrys flagrans]|uniref:Uncharacterized protein n=1 Tax=Arthrobotrys flagrans TaxID=97331 RepID=A0A436ZNQ7_ARTFL|nr:hypothetical protein DFL_008427 [Arthrobotrys flagrans]